jgi:hypothetical protein
VCWGGVDARSSNQGTVVMVETLTGKIFNNKTRDLGFYVQGGVRFQQGVVCWCEKQSCHRWRL